jgi:hypothetical protein
VIDYIDAQLLSPDKIPLLSAEIITRIKSMTDSHKQEIKQLDKIKMDVMCKIENLLDLAEDGMIDDVVKQRR